MSNDRVFLRCSVCGNLVGLVEDEGKPIFCCNEEMQVLKANSTDAATEKHVPVLERKDKSLKVTVGSVEHPMTDAHYITWIAVAQGNRTQRVALKPGDAPMATFYVEEGPVSAYAYCNLHGLWKANLA